MAPVSTQGWKVKYDGVCSRCGTALRTGEVAVYERPTRTIRCVVCPTEDPIESPEPVVDVGGAGASARREYERRKTTREARVKGRFGDRLGRVLLAVTDEPQTTRAWATGARGEEKLAKALEGIDGLRVLHDRRVPGTRGNIDHIVIAPAGVFVVDAKRYEGRIEIRNKGWFLRPDYRLYVGRRDCSALATGLEWQVEAVAAALVAAEVDLLPAVTPVLCFIDGDWPLFGAPDKFAGVRLEGPNSLRRAVTETTVLDGPSIERLARLLATALPAK
jgi:Nuclease-related domain